MSSSLHWAAVPAWRARLLTVFLAVLPVTGRGAPGVGLYHTGNENQVETMQAFADWLGAPVNYRVSYVEWNSSWERNTTPFSIAAVQEWLALSPDNHEVLGVGLVPFVDAGNFADVIAGRHDADFRRLGRLLTEGGVAARVIIRLAWEMNGEWYPWSANRAPATPGDFAAAFRRAVAMIRETAPEVRICWNPNKQHRDWDWREAYPGDASVDLVGLDAYDNHAPNGWADTLHRNPGLAEFRAFAQEHGKPECYPEWGLGHAEHQGNGDNPDFIRRMHEWFNAPGAQVAFHCFWNDSFDGTLGLFRTKQPAPRAAAEFRRLFGRVPEAESVPTAYFLSENTRNAEWAARLTKTNRPTGARLFEVRTCKPGSTYTARAWVRGSGSVNLRVLAGDGGKELAAVAIPASPEWREFRTAPFSTAENVRLTYLLVDDTADAGVLYFDDLHLGDEGMNLLSNVGFENGAAAWTAEPPFAIVHRP